MPPLDNLRVDDLARDTLEYVRVPSETGSEGPGSLFLADLLRREGFEPELDPVEPGRPNVYACWRGTDPTAPAIVFNGHTDTIPIGNSRPPALDGEWIVGRGAEDMKGGLVAMVHAASALKQSGVRLRGDVWLTGVIDHETPRGRKTGPRRLIEHLRSGRIGAQGLVIVEGPANVWSASLGSTIFHVSISSPRGILHTIHVPYRDNPVFWLGRLLNELEHKESAFQTEPPHALCGHERLNIGIVQGGDYPNRLPTPITVTGTWRWKPGRTHADVRAELDSLCARLSAESGLAFEARYEAAREPFETPAEHPLVDAVLGATRDAGCPAERIGMALVCDANLYANEAGIATVCYGPAYQTAHSDDERISVHRLLDAARVYAGAMLRFCA
ncbi:MAG: M20/M25/M40 family metallo-hydrolase [Bryobacteraceae bacterium]